METRSIGNLNRVLRTAAVICAFTTSAAWASVVWDLNPSHQNAAAGSTTETYTSQGYTITASGYDNSNGTGSPHELFFKNQPLNNGAVEFGLGLTNTRDNELQAGSSASNPFDFIQFDLAAITTAGLTNGKVKVGSIQAGESFSIFGSNTAGVLGTKLGGTFGSQFDNQFVNLPNFGQYKFYSIGAASMDVLPIALEADIPAIPEMNALMPIIGLVVAVVSTNALRRRRSARAS
jgi:hypothetical protein